MEVEQKDDSCQEPAPEFGNNSWSQTDGDQRQMDYCLNQIFIKEEPFYFQDAGEISKEQEVTSVDSKLQLSPSVSVSGHDNGTEVGGLKRGNGNSIFPEDCAKPTVSGRNDQLYSCDHCRYKTPKLCYLRKHIIRKHSSENTFNCDFCDYKSSKSCNLNVHLKKHAGEKPFSCELCDFKSYKSNALKKHLRKHSGEKPFSCQFCDFKSYKSNDLKKHLRKHSGEKPFSCEFCDFKCSISCNLKRHLRRIHSAEKTCQSPLSDLQEAGESSVEQEVTSVDSKLQLLPTTAVSSHKQEDNSCQEPAPECGSNSWTQTDVGRREMDFSLHQIFIKEEPLDFQEAGEISEEQEVTSVDSKLQLSPSVSVSGHDNGTEVGGLKRGSGNSIFPEDCAKPTVSGRNDQLYSCAHCSYKTPKLCYLRKHIRRHTVKKPFSCQFCDYKSSQSCNLRRHLRGKHSAENTFQSRPLSDLQETGESSVEQEVTSVDSKLQLLPSSTAVSSHKQEDNSCQEPAPDCGSDSWSQTDVGRQETDFSLHKIFIQDKLLGFQVARESSEEQEVTSVDSKLQLSPSTNVSGHDNGTEVGGLKRENGNSIFPEDCAKPTASGRNDQLYSCAHCSYKTPKLYNLKVHLRTHSGEKPYNCELCDYKCSTLGNLMSHFRTHSAEKRFSCELCDFKSYTSCKLKRHLRTHTGEKPFSCEFCDYKFSESGHLKRHLRTHSGEKPFSCEFCDYKTSDSGSLKTHLKKHTGENPFSCEFCEFKSYILSNFKVHLRIHSGEKPFSCGFCDFKSSESGTLKKHLRTHSGEKPFSCEFCDYKASRSSSLKNHLANHHTS